MSVTYRVGLDWRGERAAYLLIVSRQNHDGTTDHIRFVPEKMSRHGTIPEDSLTWLDDHEAQQIMLAFVTEARKHGIRPPLDAADTEATRKHLEDMRALAFGKLGVDKP